MYKGRKGILGISDLVKAAFTTPSVINLNQQIPTSSPQGTSFIELSEDEENSD